MRTILLTLSISLLLLPGCRLDEEVKAFDGTYSGTLLIDEQSWRYDEGETDQDTLYSRAYFRGPTTVTFDRGKYTTAYQEGTFRVGEGQVSFFADLENPIDCPLDTACISFFRTFPQYPYQYEFKGDSLIIAVEDIGTASGFGTPNTERVDRRYALWLEREP